MRTLFNLAAKHWLLPFSVGFVFLFGTFILAVISRPFYFFPWWSLPLPQLVYLSYFTNLYNESNFAALLWFLFFVVL